MKNIITEELGYMKYLLGYQRGVVISEQAKPISKKEKNVQAAYKLMIDGADGRLGMGTEVQKIIDGINMIKSEDELDRLFTLFKDKKTGYNDFSEMIKGEFESDNQKDLDKIVSKLNTWYDLKNKTPENFSKLSFTPITKPLTDAAPPAAAPAAAPAAEPQIDKDHWMDVVNYFSANTDTFYTGAHIVFADPETSPTPRYLTVRPKDPKGDDDATTEFMHGGDVNFYDLGRSTGVASAEWEWDGTKPVIKFNDISKNASGYVQPDDIDWSAVTDDKKIIGLNAKGPLVKKVQQALIKYNYSGDTGNSITTDVQGCLNDVEKCDGIYGPTTKEMVKQFQKDNGLAVDGIVGQQTYYAFDEL
jgi:hypothetical protein